MTIRLVIADALLRRRVRAGKFFEQTIARSIPAEDATFELCRAWWIV